MKVLVLTTAPISAEQLRGALGPDTDPKDAEVMIVARSEERRVGKECRSRWSPYH